MLIFRLEYVVNMFKTVREFLTEIRSTRIIVISSAGKLILNSLLPIFIPF